MRNPHQIEECLRHSDVVYNCAGKAYETRCGQLHPRPTPQSRADAALALTDARRNYTFEDVHVTGAASIAEIAAKNNVSRFIHVSHLNANHDSPSAMYRVSDGPLYKQPPAADPTCLVCVSVVESTRRGSGAGEFPQRDNRPDVGHLRERGQAHYHRRL